MDMKLSSCHAPQELSRRANLAVMLVITLVSFYLMSHWIWRPISPDERAYLGWALKLYKDGDYHTLDDKPIVKVPPFYVYSLAFFFKLFGPSIDVAQAVSLFFGCLGILVCYELGRRLWGWKVGLMASILLLVSCKGEYWRYSNRVLNEIPLGFFILCVIYFLCLYLRKPSWWIAVAVGCSMGLGLLTKEFAVLVLPAAGLTLVLAKERWPKKLLHLTVTLSIMFLIIGPWLIHVAEITGSPLGGVAQRGKGQAAELIKSAKAWGTRPIEDWIKMLTLFHKPAWLYQVAIIGSLLYGLWRLFRNKEFEMGVILSPIIVFFGTFGFFVALPFDLRRFVPLLPLYSLLVAISMKRCWEFLIGKGRELGFKVPAPGKLAILFFTIFCLNSLKPGRTMKDFEPFSLLSSKERPFLFDETEAAMRCVPPANVILANYRYVVYFYLQGNYTVKPLLTTMEGKKSSHFFAKKDEGEGPTDEVGSVLYDFELRGKRVVMSREFLQRQIEESGADYLIFFRTGHPKSAPKAVEEFLMEHPERYVRICEDERYAVYRIGKKQ